jgi:hypothetical protein
MANQPLTVRAEVTYANGDRKTQITTIMSDDVKWAADMYWEENQGVKVEIFNTVGNELLISFIPEGK